MAKKKNDDVEVDAPEAIEEPKADSKTSATVTWRGGTRTYSAELHGKDFKALAKEFAEKKGGTVA